MFILHDIMLVLKPKNHPVIHYRICLLYYSQRCKKYSKKSYWKGKLILLPNYYLILILLGTSFLSVHYDSFTSLPKPINAGVLHGSIATNLLFNTYISHQPTLSTTLSGDFSHFSPFLKKRFKEWGVKMNNTKSIQSSFILRNEKCTPLILN